MGRAAGILMILVLAGCSGGGPGFLDRLAPRGAETAGAAPAEAGAPLQAPMKETVPPPPDAASVEEFDTTTEEERVAAAAPVEGGEELGTTVATLGSPAEAGFWMETPLVSEVRQGRLVYAETGKSVQVELRPSGGPAGGGSRVSLAAMRVLGAPITGLPELVVYAL